AFLNIISRAHMFSEPEGATSMPEVLRMDIARLVQYYNDWQDVTIMAALLVLFKQAAGPKCTSADLREAKRVLWVLLNDSDTSMQHVTLQMCDSAGKIRGKPFSQHENDMLSGLVESTLQPDSKLYQIIRTRVGTSLECRVRGEPFEKHDLNRMGLAELDEEVAELGERIKRLVAHNWRVFGDLYMAIVDQLGGLCGTVQVEGRLEAVLSA
ncbi:T-complex 11, partial [Gaertneriomyces semiglobifer]